MLTEHQVIEWLKERYLNCLHFSKEKNGEEKLGWEEDAAYFEAAIMLIFGIGPEDLRR